MRLPQLIFVSCFSFLSLQFVATAQTKPDPKSKKPKIGIGVLEGTIAAGILSSTGIVDDMIEKAGNEGNYVIFNAAMRAKMLIENFRLSTNDIVDNGFDRLDSTQENMYAEIQTIIKSLEFASEQPIENAQRTVETVYQIMEDVPLNKKTPTVLRTYPNVIGAFKRDNYIYEVRGLHFDIANPRLEIDGEILSPIALEKQTATFSIPSKMIESAEDNIDIVTGSLLFKTKKCRAFVFCSYPEVKFPTAIMTLPRTLGTVNVTYRTIDEKRQYAEKTFTRKFSKSTGDLTKYKCSKYNQGPHEGGYFIDTDSIKVASYKISCIGSFKFGGYTIRNPACKNGKQTVKGANGRAGHSWKMLDKTPAGYSVQLCVQSQIRKLKKRSGEQNVNLAWKEYKLSDEVSETTPSELASSSNLKWDEQLLVELPKNTHSINVAITFFDGSEILAINDTTNRYVDIEWNSSSKQLVVRPKLLSNTRDIY